MLTSWSHASNRNEVVAWNGDNVGVLHEVIWSAGLGQRLILTRRLDVDPEGR
jgi:hypothetical protein